MEWAELLVHTRARWPGGWSASPRLRWERGLNLNVLCFLPASIKYLLFVAQEPAAALIWLLRVRFCCFVCVRVHDRLSRLFALCSRWQVQVRVESFIYLYIPLPPNLVFHRPSKQPLGSWSGKFKRRFFAPAYCSSNSIKVTIWWMKGSGPPQTALARCVNQRLLSAAALLFMLAED